MPLKIVYSKASERCGNCGCVMGREDVFVLNKKDETVTKSFLNLFKPGRQ